jgi:hypothetical protein
MRSLSIQVMMKADRAKNHTKSSVLATLSRPLTSAFPATNAIVAKPWDITRVPRTARRHTAGEYSSKGVSSPQTAGV